MRNSPPHFHQASWAARLWLFSPPETPNPSYTSPNHPAGLPRLRITPPVRTLPPHERPPALRPLTGGTWSWFWHSETGSPGKPSSTGTPGRARVPGLRASRRTEEGVCRGPAPRPSAQPAPSKDTDDDRHSGCHLPNLFVRLHDLFDPRLPKERGRARTPSPASLRGSWNKGVSREEERGTKPGGHGRGRGVRPRTPKSTRSPTSRTWARGSREPSPPRPSPATCSPAETARYTSSSCLASPGLSRRAGPSAAARSLGAPGLFAAGPPRSPRVLVPPTPLPPLPSGS